jgi:hypothetical protein
VYIKIVLKQSDGIGISEEGVISETWRAAESINVSLVRDWNASLASASIWDAICSFVVGITDAIIRTVGGLTCWTTVHRDA